MIKFILDNIFAIIALLFSLLSLILHFRSYIKETVRLKITQISNKGAFNFSFTWYKKYTCLFFYVDISNPSKTDTSINNFTLIDEKGASYSPDSYDIGDLHSNDNGLTLYSPVPSKEPVQSFDLKSDNLLSYTRIPSNGNISGYLVFFDVPVIEDVSKYTLKATTPSGKIFEESIVVNPLPSSMQPYHL